MTRIFAIVQARMGSTRLPGKVMMDVSGRPAIWHLMHRLKYAEQLTDIVLATTTNPLDDVLEAYAQRNNWNVFRGSEEDVLDRYYNAAKMIGCNLSDAIVRLTGDDILVDPRMVDLVVSLFLSHQRRVSHACNDRVPTYPYGAGVEVFSLEALTRAWRNAVLQEHREHVTPYIRKNPDLFPFVEIRSGVNYSNFRFSIDYQEDLNFNRIIFEKLFKEDGPPFSMMQTIQYIEENAIKHEGSIS